MLRDAGRLPSVPGTIPLTTKTRRAPPAGTARIGAAYARWHSHSRAHLFLIERRPCAPAPGHAVRSAHVPSDVLVGDVQDQRPPDTRFYEPLYQVCPVGMT